MCYDQSVSPILATVNVMLMLAVLVSCTQKYDWLNGETPREKRDERRPKMYFTVILRVNLHKESIEKEWSNFGQNMLNQLQAREFLTLRYLKYVKM